MDDLLNRYIYAIGEKLPKDQREDIEKELRSLLMDTIDEKTSKNKLDKDVKSIEEITKEVIEEFGSPSEIAARYYPQKKYLIGPELINLYFVVLKIVLIANFIGITVAILVNGVVNDLEYKAIVSNFFEEYISIFFTTIGSITMIFALIEKFNPDLSSSNKKDYKWNITKLKNIPQQINKIKYSNTIASICFLIIAIVFLNIFIDNFKDFPIGNIYTVVKIDIFKDYMIFINIILLMNLILHVYNLIVREWTIISRLYSIVLSIFSVILFAKIFTEPNIIDNSLDFLVQDKNKIVNFIIIIAIVISSIEVSKNIRGIYKSKK